MKDSNIQSSALFHKLLATSPEFSVWSCSEMDIVKKHITQHDTILDLGCGWGRFIKELCPICKRIIGLDYDFNEIKEAQKHVGKVENVLFTVQDGRATSFKCQSFDTIIMMGNIFGNIDSDSRQEILDEAIRLVAKNGQILISAYSQKVTPFRVEMYKKAGLVIKSVSNSKIVFENSWFSEAFNKPELLEILARPHLDVILHDINTIGFVAKLSIKKELS